MRIFLFALIGSSMIAPANAATPLARTIAWAECYRLAAAQNFGRRHIQRRNFIQDCLIDRGFNAQ
jgi:hypothetical protein